MGFGYLLIGYLVAFVLHLTVGQLGFGGITLLLGYGLLLRGSMLLRRYHKAFSYSLWLLCPLLLTAAYELLKNLDTLFLWNLPLTASPIAEAMGWISFLLLICWNLAMLYGIRMLARDLGVLHSAAVAVRNSILVGIYAMLYLIARMPLPQSASWQSYFAWPLALLNVIWVICNLVLLLSCNKNFCPAGEENQPVRPSRFAFLNHMNESYEQTRQKAVDRSREDVEQALRRRREKKNAKQNKRKK